MSIQYINANAGTGKTYTLTERMANSCAGTNGLDPSQFIFTTFTRNAAADFKERARQKMVEKGLLQKANRLDMALIGTIDSVAEKFVFKYWYLLGLSPKLNIMTSVSKSEYVARTLQCIYSNQALMDFFMEFRVFFGISDYDFWEKHLKSVVDGESLYNFDTSANGPKNFFENSRNESLQFCGKLCNGKSFKSANLQTLEYECINSLEEIQNKENLTTDTGRKRYNLIKEFINELSTSTSDVKYVKFLDFYCNELIGTYKKASKEIKLKKTQYKKILSGDFSEVEELFDEVEKEDLLHDDERTFIVNQRDNINKGIFDWNDVDSKWHVDFDNSGKPFVTVSLWAKDIVALYDQLKDIYYSKEAKYLIEIYINTIFNEAISIEKGYRQFKEENHLLEYHDIERYFLELLSNPIVKQEISNQYKVIYVDEYQDCSPLQVKIFYEMSKLIDENVWVGDKKQAIYGFRGANLDLNVRVANWVTSHAMQNVSSLTTNYRSYPEIVRLSNYLFKDIPSFGIKGCSLPSKKMIAERNAETSFHALHYLDCSYEKIEKYYSAIASKVKEIIDSGRKPEDIAVLLLTGGHCDYMVKELNRLSIPVNRGLSTLAGNKSVQLMSALLKLVVNPSDRMAMATVATLTSYGYDAGRIIDSALLDSTGFLKTIPLLSAFNERKDVFNFEIKPLSAIVKSLVYELDLNRYAHQWELGDSHSTVLDFICDLAVEYENQCKEQSLPSTVEGFRIYMDDYHSKDSESTLSAGALSNGVVVTTCHKSKGLQWDVVVMPDFDFDSNHHPINKAFEFDVEGVRMQEGCAISSNPNNFESSLKYMWMRLFPIPLKHIREKVAKFQGKNSSKTIEDEVIEASKNEKLRLLYVSLTRPRKQLYIASNTKPKSSKASSLEWLNLIEKKVTVNINGANTTKTLGAADILDRKQEFIKNPNETIVTEKNIVLAQEDECLLDKFVSVEKMLNKLGWPEISDKKAQLAPSSTYGTFVSTLRNVTTGSQNRYTKSGNQDENGTLVHNIFCSLEKLGPSVRVAEIDRMIKDSGLAANFDPKAPQYINEAWNYLEAWLKKQGGIIAFYHELPFIHMNDDSQLVAGDMDLLCEYGDKQVILVDYKTYPGALYNIITPTDKHYAGRYAGQFRCYRDALEVGGYTVTHSIVYYPEIQTIVELDLDNPV